MILKKRIILISAIAVLFIALTLVYAFVLSPMLHTDNGEEEITLLPGEALGEGKSLLMFEHIPRERIQSIEVFNQYGNYKLYYDNIQEDFFIEEYMNAPYSKEMLSALIVNAGYTATMKRVTEKTDNLSEYGLAESDNPAYYVLTTRDNKTFKVFLGKMIPTGAGFYAKYADRDAVYIVEASVSQNLLAPIDNLMTPMLFLPLSQSNYFLVKDFILARNGKAFIEITSETKIGKDDNGKDTEEFKEYKMVYPTNYAVSTNYDTLLQGFIDCTGNSVVYTGKDKEEISADILEKYNLKNPAYELLFTHNGIKNNVLISSKNEDGTYYAYSLVFNMICVMPGEAFEFLKWELMDYVEKPLVQFNINDVTSITVTSKDFDETFLLYFSEGESTKNPVTGAVTTTTDLQVKLKSNGTFIPNPKNFRQFYMVLLTTNLVTYSDVKDETGLDCLATIRILTKDGKKLEYAFYPYATRRCFYTLNGKGEFYVLKDAVEKIVSDAKKVIKGETVSYQSKN